MGNDCIVQARLYKRGSTCIVVETQKRGGFKRQAHGLGHQDLVALEAIQRRRQRSPVAAEMRSRFIPEAWSSTEEIVPTRESGILNLFEDLLTADANWKVLASRKCRTTFQKREWVGGSCWFGGLRGVVDEMSREQSEVKWSPGLGERESTRRRGR